MDVRESLLDTTKSFEDRETELDKWAGEIEATNDMTQFTTFLRTINNVAASIIDKYSESQLVVDNFDIDIDFLRFVARFYERACCLFDSTEKIEQIHDQPSFLLQTYKLLVASAPNDSSSALKPQLSHEAMGKILQAAREGKQLSNAEIYTEENVDAELQHKRALLSCWTRLRRAVVGCLRNITQLPSATIRLDVSSVPGLVHFLAHIPHNVVEEGIIISYSCTILRFLLTPVSTLCEYPATVCEICMSDEDLPYLIGTAVTNRVVQLPDGGKLWVHMEATRMLAALIIVCPDENLPRLMSSVRALCDAVLTSTHTSLHLEMVDALLRLFNDSPDVTRSQFVRAENSEPKRPVVFLAELNDRRLTESSLGLIIMNTKHYLDSGKTNEPAKDALLKGVQILEAIAPYCADQLIERNALTVLSTISAVLPEATNVIELIEKHRKKANPPETKQAIAAGNEANKEPELQQQQQPESNNSAPRNNWFSCPLL